MDWSEELKNVAKQRRELKLQSVRIGLGMEDRLNPTGKEYRRNIKHKPRSAYEWEELED